MINNMVTKHILTVRNCSPAFGVIINNMVTKPVLQLKLWRYTFVVMINNIKIGETMKTNRVEQHKIKKNNPDWIIIDDLSWKSKNIYNYGNYIVRQEFIKTSKEKREGLREYANWINYYDLTKMCKMSEPFKELGAVASNYTLKILDKNWKSFFSSIKDWIKNKEKYKGKPSLPNYLDKENGRFNVTVHNESFKIINNKIIITWKPLKSLSNKYTSHINVEESKLMQCRFIPKGDDYIMEVVYQIDVPDITHETERIASIDLGVDNLMTVTNNCGIEPIIINGKPLKSINQFYNKEMARMKSELMIKNGTSWSKNLQRLTTKRNNKVADYIHKSTKMVIDYCIENNIDTLVCGYNKGWKQDANIGKINNQKFVQIPHKSVVDKLKYKYEGAGIIFKINNESYTSGTSFLDKEKPNKKYYNKSRRVHRGLFIANNGQKINADVNGSYQIMVKTFPKAFKDGIEEAYCHPIRLNIG